MAKKHETALASKGLRVETLFLNRSKRLGKAWHSYLSYYQIEYWLKSRTRSSPYLAKQNVLKISLHGRLWSDIIILTY